MCGLYDYKSKIIAKQRGELTFGWLVHLAFNILLLGAAKSRCRYYLLPWLVEGMLVTVGLGGLACYCVYCGIVDKQLLITQDVMNSEVNAKS